MAAAFRTFGHYIVIMYTMLLNEVAMFGFFIFYIVMCFAVCFAVIVSETVPLSEIFSILVEQVQI